MSEDKTIIIVTDGKENAVSARPKNFKTGSRGFYVWGKVLMGGKKYQLSGNLVEIGSKAKE